MRYLACTLSVLADRSCSYLSFSCALVYQYRTMASKLVDMSFFDTRYLKNLNFRFSTTTRLRAPKYLCLDRKSRILLKHCMLSLLRARQRRTRYCFWRRMSSTALEKRGAMCGRMRTCCWLACSLVIVKCLRAKKWNLTIYGMNGSSQSATEVWARSSWPM